MNIPAFELRQQYQLDFDAYRRRCTEFLRLLTTLKQGMWLLLLSSFFLFYYLLDVVEQIMTLL
jgi:hypothetical protein